MAIDTNLLYKAVREVIVRTDEEQGNKLSTMKSGLPSIARSRGSTPKLNYPYVMIDIGTTRPTVSNLTNKFLNDDGYLQYEVNKEYIIKIKVYSDRGDSYEIANNLEFAFSFDHNLDFLYTYCEATVTDTQPVTPLPDILSDDSLVEYNQFDLTLSVRDVYVDENASTVDKIEISGGVSDGSTTLPVGIDVDASIGI